jgi:hypothetical protein
MSVLYLLTESDCDDLFYEGCAERITGRTFSSHPFRLRKGSGLVAVRASFRLMLRALTRFQADEIHFIVAQDNDRAPHMAREAIVGNDRQRLAGEDQRKSNRHDELVKVAKEHLGHDSASWKVRAALAVPVDMVESWLLLIRNGGDAGDLPRFSRKASSLAVRYHHPAAPPEQLKDLAEAQMVADGFSTMDEWALHLVTERLDAADLATRSESFALFKAWFDSW